MSEAVTAVFTRAMQLTEAERGELIDRLTDTLPPPSVVDDATDEQFAAELHRRAAELRDDPTAGIPWERVREME
jgi:putative addiction module component (TIGR02574 family)